MPQGPSDRVLHVRGRHLLVPFLNFFGFFLKKSRGMGQMFGPGRRRERYESFHGRRGGRKGSGGFYFYFSLVCALQIRGLSQRNGLTRRPWEDTYTTTAREQSVVSWSGHIICYHNMLRGARHQGGY